MPTAAQSNPATIDPARKAQLTVVKSAGDPFTQYGDPTNPLANGSREPIPGVDFTIRRVKGVDLTTNEGWQAAQEMKVTDFYPAGKHADALDHVQLKSTNASGKAVFSNLDLGLYYVEEVVESAQENHLTISEPFLVTLPHTDATRSAWMYELTVNPKNQKLRATKNVQQKCFEKGDHIEYGISANAPAVADNQVLGRYELVDPLPTGTSLVADASTVHLSVPAQDDTYNITELSSKDFTIRIDGTVAYMELTESGLKKLSDLRRDNPATQVTWRYFLAFDEVEREPVTNKGYLLVDGYPKFDLERKPGVPTNPVVIEPCPEPGKTPPPTTTTPVVPTYPDRVPPTTPITPTTPTATPTPPVVTTPPETPRVPDVPRLPIPVPEPGTEPEPVPTPTTPVPDQPRTPGLAETGANTLWVFAGGALLVLAGLIFLLRSRRAKDAE